MTVKVIPEGMTFNFNGKDYTYSYESIMKRVREVEKKYPSDTTVDHIIHLAAEFGEDYGLAVGIAQNYPLMKGIIGVILAHLLDLFQKFLLTLLDATAYACRVTFKFFEWIFSE